MKRAPGESAKDVMQAIAVACTIGFLSLIAHKGVVDISALAAKYSGREFWVRLARYVIANLAS